MKTRAPVARAANTLPIVESIDIEGPKTGEVLVGDMAAVGLARDRRRSS